MKIDTYGIISDIIDKEIDILLPLKVGELRSLLESNFPKLSQFNYSLVIDNEIISDEMKLIEHSNSIAIMPPFSGG
ncbi:MAG: MoaD/ThiS family protein [Candidatus Kapabacteria bacterium]|nr:MoaD/ThiS family protein [Candidatus Kapabacteria bacterium]